MASLKFKKKKAKFEKARAEKYSSIAFDIAKAIFVGSLGASIFEDWGNPYQKIIVLLAGFSSSFLFFKIGIQYLKTTHLFYDR